MMSVVIDLRQGSGQGDGVVDHAAPFFVGHIFPRPGNAELDDRRSQGRYDSRHQEGYRIAFPVVVTAAAEDGSPLGDVGNHAYGAGEAGHDSADEDIPMQDMAHFMGQDAADFIFIEEMRVEANVGIYDRERVTPQMVEINLTFGVPDEAAADDEVVVPVEVVVVGVVELQADSEMAEAARSARPAFIVKCRLM